jgi:hypothetical protein
MNDISQTKLIRHFAAQALLTGKLPCGIFGNEKQLSAFSEAFYATRQFDRILAESENLSEVTKALSVKRAAAARFRREFGIKWPA